MLVEDECELWSIQETKGQWRAQGKVRHYIQLEVGSDQ